MPPSPHCTFPLLRRTAGPSGTFEISTGTFCGWATITNPTLFRCQAGMSRKFLHNFGTHFSPLHTTQNFDFHFLEGLRGLGLHCCLSNTKHSSAERTFSLKVERERPSKFQHFLHFPYRKAVHAGVRNHCEWFHARTGGGNGARSRNFCTN